MSEEQSNLPVHRALDETEMAIKRLEIQRQVLIQKGMSSDNPDDIMKSYAVYDLIQRKHDSTRKSIIVDPTDFTSSFGYKDKPFSLSYDMLQNMSKVPIINAVIKTRVNQVAAFAEPQKDKYSMGFVVRRKKQFGDIDRPMSKKDIKEANRIINFLEQCGEGFSFEGDSDFDTFIRKITRDSLIYDQMCFETTFDRKGVPYAFYSTDATTMRIADTFDDDTVMSVPNSQIWVSGQKNQMQPINMRKSVKGYFPSYVQTIQGSPVEAFYPWEMCFGVRNASTSIYSNGYGCSELEELVLTITSLIWGEEYNRRFFKQGSVPKGLLRVSGQINDTKLAQFKQEWNATMRGVYNAWKTPILEGDKVEWVDLQKSNSDMEYHAWIEFLIKVCCAVWCIDPAEINFPLDGSADSGGIKFGGDNKERLQHSKDKGLYPLLKFQQMKINRNIVYPMNPEFEFVYVGLNTIDASTELDMDVKKVQYYVTVNELRREKGLPKIEGGDIILNPVFAAQLMQQQQANMANSAGSTEGEPDMFDMTDLKGEENGQQDNQDNEQVGSVDTNKIPETTPEKVKDENPIQKAFTDFINTIKN